MLLTQAPLNLITRLYLITTYSSSKLSLLILHYYISFITSTTHTTHQLLIQRINCTLDAWIQGVKVSHHVQEAKASRVFGKAFYWETRKTFSYMALFGGLEKRFWEEENLLEKPLFAWSNWSKALCIKEFSKDWFNHNLIPYTPKSDRWAISCFCRLHSMRIWYQASKERSLRIDKSLIACIGTRKKKPLWVMKVCKLSEERKVLTVILTSLLVPCVRVVMSLSMTLNVRQVSSCCYW